MIIVSRPLVRRGLSILHSIGAKAGRFESLMGRVTVLVVCSTAESLPLRSVRIRAPYKITRYGRLTNEGLTFIPVLHTNLNVMSNTLTLIPSTGIKRVNLCESRAALRPIRCCYGLPGSVRRESIFIISPVLTANNSTVSTVNRVGGEGPHSVGFLYVVTTPRKLRTLGRTRPSISVFITNVSSRLGRGKCVIPNLNSTNSEVFNAGWSPGVFVWGTIRHFTLHFLPTFCGGPCLVLGMAYFKKGVVTGGSGVGVNGSNVCSTHRLNANGVIILNFRRVFTVFNTAMAIPLLANLSVSAALLFTNLNALLFRYLAGFGIPTFLNSSFTFVNNCLTITPLRTSKDKGGRLLPCTYLNITYTNLICLVITTLVGVINMGGIVGLFPPIMANPVVVTVNLNLTPSTIGGYGAG